MPKKQNKFPQNYTRQAIKHWPESERPREKLLQVGPERLSDGELLAVQMTVMVVSLLLVFSGRRS